MFICYFIATVFFEGLIFYSKLCAYCLSVVWADFQTGERCLIECSIRNNLTSLPGKIEMLIKLSNDIFGIHGNRKQVMLG